MRGEVLHYDDELGVGFITGQDQLRYGFERSDLRRLIPIGKGTRVEFRQEDGRARDIFVVQGERATGPQVYAQTSQQQFGRYASITQGPAEHTGLWSYFVRALSVNYANFSGRARRKEYWGYFLFLMLSFVVIVSAGMLVDGGIGSLAYGDSAPVFTLVLGGLFWLGTFIPSLAMCIRRQHDIGLSGWFYLLVLIPYVGGLILFVFSLISSQKHDNKWGPIPYGVRI